MPLTKSAAPGVSVGRALLNLFKRTRPRVQGKSLDKFVHNGKSVKDLRSAVAAAKSAADDYDNLLRDTTKYSRQGAQQSKDHAALAQRLKEMEAKGLATLDDAALHKYRATKHTYDALGRDLSTFDTAVANALKGDASALKQTVRIGKHKGALGDYKVSFGVGPDGKDQSIALKDLFADRAALQGTLTSANQNLSNATKAFDTAFKASLGNRSALRDIGNVAGAPFRLGYRAVATKRIPLWAKLTTAGAGTTFAFGDNAEGHTNPFWTQDKSVLDNAYNIGRRMGTGALNIKSKIFN